MTQKIYRNFIKHQTLYTSIAIGAILLLAMFFRFWQLDTIPPGLYIDEAANGNDAIQAMLTGDYKVFYPDNYGREGLHITLTSFVFKILGVGVWQLRFIGALAGVLTVLGIYFLAREFFVRSVALLASFFAAFSFWPVALSRVAFRASLAAMLLVWSFYFLWRGLRERSMKLSGLYFVLFSILFGLGLYTYIAFRAAIAIVIAIFIVEFIKYLATRKKIKIKFLVKDGWWRWLMAAGVFVVVVTPLLLALLSQPEIFLGRTSNISVFNTEQPWQAFLDSSIRTLGMFHISGDPLWRHGLATEPLLSFTIGGLFLLGLLVIVYFSHLYQLKERHQNYGWFWVWWLLIMITPSMLSTDMIPHSLRSIGAIPAVYIVSAVGAVAVWRWLHQFYLKDRGNLLLPVVGMIVICFIGLIASEHHRYFDTWANHPEVGFEYIEQHIDLADYLMNLSADQQVFVVVDVEGGPDMDGLPGNAQSLIFLTYGADNIVFIHPDQLNKMDDIDKAKVISMNEWEAKYRASIGKEWFSD